MSRAFITGCAGFIGSHLAERLLADGWDVDGIDDLSTGRWENVPSGVRWRKGVVAEIGIGLQQLNVVFHLAARLGPADVVRDPLRLLIEHHDDTLAVCEFALRNKAVLMLASTSEVYQLNPKTPFREDDDLLLGPSHLPRCAYAVSKLAAEHIVLAYARQHGLKAIIARLFNVVGPRQREAFVLPIFARQALQGGPITIHGDGSQQRCFTHVLDTIDMFIRLAICASAYGQIVNIGTRNPITIGEVALRVATHCATVYSINAPIEHVSWSVTGDDAWARMCVREPDMAKYVRLIGCEPSTAYAYRIIEDVCDNQADRLGIRRKAA